VVLGGSVLVIGKTFCTKLQFIV